MTHTALDNLETAAAEVFRSRYAAQRGVNPSQVQLLAAHGGTKIEPIIYPLEGDVSPMDIIKEGQIHAKTN